jgi:hypothetical protein
MNWFRTSTVALCIIAAFVSGCGGKYFRPYVLDPAASTIIRKEESGLKVAINPLLDLQSCKTNFGIDCLQKGILPVYIRATNGNSGTTYRIVANDIWFGSAAERRVSAGLQQTNYVAAGSSLGVAGGVLAGISAVPGILVAGAGMKATDDAESIQENFVIKQFQNVTLTPGRSAEGFVYFVQTAPISINALPPLNIAVCNVSNHTTNLLCIPLIKMQ